MPGVSTRAAIQSNHSRMVEADARAGKLAGNPGRYLRYAAETPFRLLGKRRPFL